MNDYTAHSRPHKSSNRCDVVAPEHHHPAVPLAVDAAAPSRINGTVASRSDRWCGNRSTTHFYDEYTPKPNTTTTSLRMMPPSTQPVAVEHHKHPLTRLHRCGGDLSESATAAATAGGAFRRGRPLGTAGLAIDASTLPQEEAGREEKFQRRDSKKRVGFEPHPVQQVHYPATTTIPMLNDGTTMFMVGADGYALTGGTTRGRGFDSVNERWYSHRELVEMKRAAKRACTTRPDLEYALNDAYHCDDRQRGLPTSSEFTAVEETETEVECGTSRRPDPTASSSLSASSAQGESLDAQQMLLEIPFFREQRGMERWCSKRHALSRGLTVLQVKTEVFVAQARKSMGSNGTNGEAADFDGRRSSAAGPCPAEHEPHPCSLDGGHGSRTHLPGDSSNAAIAASAAAAARDDVCLADACAAASAPAVRFAQLLGRIDAIEAAEPDFVTPATTAVLTASDSALFPEDWNTTPHEAASLDVGRTADPAGDYALEESAAFFFD